MTKSSYWPYGIICFFICIIGLNCFLFYLANSTAVGMVESNPYEKGNAFQSEIDGREDAVKNKLSIKGAVQGSGATRQLLVSLLQDGSPLQGARVVASFMNPSHGSRDSQRELLPNGKAYTTSLHGMEGNWLVTYTVLWEGRKILFHDTVLVP